MEKLTDKQYKTRWIDIKKQIKERPLLAYRVNIPLDKWDEYMHSFPSKNEIDRVYIAIQEDRRNKTLRIKKELSKIIGYRESKEFGRKIRVSDTSIRQILEGKKEMAGYDLINRIELFLNVTMPDFELSIENKLDIKTFSVNTVGEIASEIIKISDNLKQYSFNLTEQARKQENDIDWNGNEVSPTLYLEKYIESLSKLKNNIDLFWGTYIDKR